MTLNPRPLARTAAILYLVIFLAAGLGEAFLFGKLVVDGNTAATAANIAGAEQLWRLGTAATILTMLCDVGISWLLFLLFAPIDRAAAMLAAIFRLVYVAVYAPAIVANYLALPLATQNARDAMAIALRAHNAGFALSLVFFGCNLAIYGWLLSRKPFAVSWLAIALQVSGACYVINSFAIFAAPAIHNLIFPWILLPPFVGEIGLMLWLFFARRFPGETQTV